MIHFMPFTYIPAARIEPLVRALGPLSVLQPLAAMATPAMRQAADQGGLHLRPCEGIDARRLNQATKDFAAWAELHKGHGGQLAGIFQFETARAASALEESPNLIRDRLKRGATPMPHEVPDPLLQAALFLNLAHTFDGQQDALQDDLGSVQAMEARLSHLLGESADDDSFPAVDAGSPALNDPTQDRGQQMTAQRLHAWARLALATGKRDLLYVTDSRAIWAHLMEMLPDALPLGQWPMDAPSAAALLIQDLERLAQETDPAVALPPTPPNPTRPAGQGFLTVHALVGCPAHKMFARLLKHVPEAGADPVEALPPRNTLIGYIGL